MDIPLTKKWGEMGRKFQTMYRFEKLIKRGRKKVDLDGPPEGWKGYYFTFGNDDSICVRIQDDIRNVLILINFYLITVFEIIDGDKKYSKYQHHKISTPLKISKGGRDYQSNTEED